MIGLIQRAVVSAEAHQSDAGADALALRAWVEMLRRLEVKGFLIIEWSGPMGLLGAMRSEDIQDCARMAHGVTKVIHVSGCDVYIRRHAPVDLTGAPGAWYDPSVGLGIGNETLQRAIGADERVAALEADVSQLKLALAKERALVADLKAQLAAKSEAELAAMRSMALPKVGVKADAQEPTAPVSAAIEPLPEELEPILGRDAIWALVRPDPDTETDCVIERHEMLWTSINALLQTRGEEGSKVPQKPLKYYQDGGVIERHEVLWVTFCKLVESRGEEGSKVLRKPLQDYVDSLVGLRFTAEEKLRVVARLNFMMRSLGLRARFGDAVGPIGVNGGSLRVQMSRRREDGRCSRAYARLGVSFPPGVLVVPEAAMERAKPSRKSGNWRHLNDPG